METPRHVVQPHWNESSFTQPPRRQAEIRASERIRAYFMSTEQSPHILSKKSRIGDAAAKNRYRRLRSTKKYKRSAKTKLTASNVIVEMTDTGLGSTRRGLEGELISLKPLGAFVRAEACPIVGNTRPNNNFFPSVAQRQQEIRTDPSQLFLPFPEAISTSKILGGHEKRGGMAGFPHPGVNNASADFWGYQSQEGLMVGKLSDVPLPFGDTGSDWSRIAEINASIPLVEGVEDIQRMERRHCNVFNPCIGAAIPCHYPQADLSLGDLATEIPDHSNTLSFLGRRRLDLPSASVEHASFYPAELRAQEGSTGLSIPNLLSPAEGTSSVWPCMPTVNTSALFSAGGVQDANRIDEHQSDIFHPFKDSPIPSHYLQTTMSPPYLSLGQWATGIPGRSGILDPLGSGTLPASVEHALSSCDPAGRRGPEVSPDPHSWPAASHFPPTNLHELTTSTAVGQPQISHPRLSVMGSELFTTNHDIAKISTNSICIMRDVHRSHGRNAANDGVLDIDFSWA
ncbi:hypothetical protein CVT26_004366 [Gymnopilus dilepis]|uniref:Uncharacterized protein n=1 Tax=Gymnopilus dilepis TaxID=231916 RepID=A0A409W6U7_9AGAR|nr:hypothetical protein CVT26_004366 [Gymnopilus dilepis]